MAKIKATANPKTAPKKKATATTKKKAGKPVTKEKKPPQKPPKLYYCSFCRKSSETRRRLIAGPNYVFICDECVVVCNAILLGEDKEFWTARLNDIITGKKKFKIENVKDTENEAKK